MPKISRDRKIIAKEEPSGMYHCILLRPLSHYELPKLRRDRLHAPPIVVTPRPFDPERARQAEEDIKQLAQRHYEWVASQAQPSLPLIDRISGPYQPLIERLGAPIQLDEYKPVPSNLRFRKTKILYRIKEYEKLFAPTVDRLTPVEQIYKSLLTLNHYVCLYPELYRSAPGKAAIYERPAYLDVALGGLDIADLNSQINNMSNSLTTLVPVLDGSNWREWSSRMKAYLMSQGQWYVIESTLPAEGAANRETWVGDNHRAMGNISLRVNASILERLAAKTTAGEMWNDLESRYSQQGVAAVFAEFKAAMNVVIPINSHPGPAMEEMFARFERLSTLDCKIPSFFQGMLLISKLPGAYDMVVQLTSQNTDVKKVDPASIRQAVIRVWEQKSSGRSQQRSQGSGGEAKKLSAIKRKGKDPSFKQQQQQRRQNGDGSSQQQQKGKARRGKRKGQKSSDNDHDHAHLASTATISDGPTATVDPRALLRKPVRVNGPEGETKYPTLKRAFNLAHELDVTPTPERIRTLEGVIKAVDKGESTSRIVEVPSDTDSAGSHSSKRTRLTLAERIDWTERDDDAESAISLGNEEDDVDMDIAQAAGLYEQYDEQVRGDL
ncbi:hypothetical protein NUW54_g144 [Trametes sanguinea]|uniref:Uncharacterized protein n=1 Tax=Trametes sanguinea TaxID=158606 RepID=A0ACC1QD49_9APHY|nr:hypothetical protein NUW54_g144 [Trametes sanguinea]